MPEVNRAKIHIPEHCAIKRVSPFVLPLSGVYGFC